MSSPRASMIESRKQVLSLRITMGLSSRAIASRRDSIAEEIWASYWPRRREQQILSSSSRRLLISSKERDSIRSFIGILPFFFILCIYYNIFFYKSQKGQKRLEKKKEFLGKNDISQMSYFFSLYIRTEQRKKV